MPEALVEQLAAFAVDLSPGALPAAVGDSVVARVLDIVGVALAASALETSKAVRDHAVENGGAPQATAIGVRAALPAASAAFVNGVLAHSLDYDDTHLPSILHPSASVVPAALAAGQAYGRNGADVAAAVAAGIEICVRVGMAGYDGEKRQSIFFERGLHATSICGTVGGAAAAGMLAGLDARGIASAMGVACSMASGIIEANRAGGTVKRIHCGWAAHAAVTAADLARRGITGPPTALEGRFGLFEALLGGRADAASVVAGLGSEWAVPGIHFKPYPANHFTHAGIDAAIALREREGVTAADVAAAHLRVAGATVRTIGEPIERKQAPATGYEAQFSGPYTIAAAFIGGGGLGLGLDDFRDDLVHDAARRTLMSKVTVGADERCERIYPDELPAVLEVTTVDGARFEEAVLANRGGPRRPLSADELAVKFRDNARRVLPEAGVSEVESAARRLLDLASLDDLLGPTTDAKEF